MSVGLAAMMHLFEGNGWFRQLTVYVQLKILNAIQHIQTAVAHGVKHKDQRNVVTMWSIYCTLQFNNTANSMINYLKQCCGQ